MQQSEPKDLRLARRAYEAFWGEQPQIWFDQLSHDYQMRWVRAVRAAREELTRVGMPTPAIGKRPYSKQVARIRSVEEAKAILASIPTKPDGKRDFSSLHPPDKRRAQNAVKYIRMHKR